MRLLVTGATGYVGSRLVTALLAAGHQVLAATRDAARLARLGWFDDVTPVALDTSDAESVRAAFASVGQVDVVYYLVHAIGQPGSRDADRAAAGNVRNRSPGPCRARRAAGRNRSTRWPIHTTLPTAIRRGPGAMRCGASTC